MKADWEESGTPLKHYLVFRVNARYVSTFLARVWYPVHLEPTEETVHKDLLVCGWWHDIEVVTEPVSELACTL